MSTAAEKFDLALYTLAKESFTKHKNYAYAAGYFQAVALNMFKDLPKQCQEKFLRQIENAAKEVAE